MSPPGPNAQRLLRGQWQIEPSHANIWTFNGDGTITMTNPDTTAPPAKGTYSWVSDDTIEIKAADEGPDAEKFEERVVIRSIDESLLVIEKPGQPKSRAAFTRMGK